MCLYKVAAGNPVVHSISPQLYVLAVWLRENKRYFVFSLYIMISFKIINIPTFHALLLSTTLKLSTSDVCENKLI